MLNYVWGCRRVKGHHATFLPDWVSMLGVEEGQCEQLHVLTHLNAHLLFLLKMLFSFQTTLANNNAYSKPNKSILTGAVGSGQNSPALKQYMLQVPLRHEIQSSGSSSWRNRSISEKIYQTTKHSAELYNTLRQDFTTLENDPSSSYFIFHHNSGMANLSAHSLWLSQRLFSCFFSKGSFASG